MATIIRIKRRLDEEPSENIVIKSKRSRVDSSDVGACSLPGDKSTTVLMRVGTLVSKEDPLEPLVLNAIKKGWELREHYKKLGPETCYKENARLEAKKRAVCKRYKIITQSRGIGEPQLIDKESTFEEDGKEKINTKNDDIVEGAEALPPLSKDFTYFDAVLANEKDNIITCNGVPMETEQYVYDVFYSSQTVDWTEVMEKNMCEIEQKVFESISSSDSDDRYEDDDDENDESNWRNDYPDYDDSPYEDEEEYLNVQIRRNCMKSYDTDESYDLENYEDEGFDVDGSLIQDFSLPSLTRAMRAAHLEDSDSDDD